ncbi:RcnB family protein [Acinetobacter portensis]|uniref:RcnB family protein n=1 Tax=Acinetobacter portensis TaxID=1839785 RepID=UPI0013D2DA07|nr:RcnB family protein [Acinetobacter portensis]
MKKILSILAISFSALMASSLTAAAPHHDDDRGYNGPRDMQTKREYRDSENNDKRFEKRRMREERGVQRLQQLKWQEGYVMPQHYRGNSYKIDYKDNNLEKPSRNEQWYKINNSYILVNTDSNTITSIVD